MRRIVAVLLCLSVLCLPVKAQQEGKYVALTFDDGPSGRFTRELLKGLQKRNVKATFLLCGYRVEQYPELTARIAREGHEIGCHGYSHKDMRAMSRRDIADEIVRMERLLPEGVALAFLRPPGGGVSDGVRQVAKARNLAILNWSVDPRDWATRDAAAIEHAVVDHVRSGDVILLHDMSESSVAAALSIIDRLKGQGFTFVTASQLAKITGTRLIPGQVYCRFE